MSALWFWHETKQPEVLFVREWRYGIDTRFYRDGET